MGALLAGNIWPETGSGWLDTLSGAGLRCRDPILDDFDRDTTASVTRVGYGGRASTEGRVRGSWPPT